VTDNHRPSDRATVERKQRALRAYDAWVKADLTPRRPRLIYLWISMAVAATLLIAAVLIIHGSTVGNRAEEERSPDDSAKDRVAADGVKDRILLQIRQLSLEQHIDVARAVEAGLSERLLTPAPEWMARKPMGPKTGVNRILNRGPFDGMISIRGGGAYFSFSKRSNSYDDSPQLAMQLWKFDSGFAGGDCGLVEPVPVQVQGVDAVSLSTFPSYFRQPARTFYQWHRQQRVRPASVVVGTVYLVRAVRWRDSDILAAFEVLEKDAYGVTFAWKVLQANAVPDRP
jgi:hypothetical protein